MFEKIVVVDSTGLNTWGVERLKELGKEVVFYTGIPETDEEEAIQGELRLMGAKTDWGADVS